MSSGEGLDLDEGRAIPPVGTDLLSAVIEEQ
jgi:hypothetical protein